MKKTMVTLMLLLIPASWGHCQTSSVKVTLTADDQGIFQGQAFRSRVEVTNTGTQDLHLPRPDRAGFSDLLSIDDSQLYFSGGVGMISINGEDPLVTVKPGESIGTTISVSGKARKDGFTFKAGFKIAPDAPVVWSEPITVHFKKDEDFPVKLEATMKDSVIDIASINTPKMAVAHVRVTNTSNLEQVIGQEPGGPMSKERTHELQNLISDHQDILIVSGPVVGCLSHCDGTQEVVLKPGRHM